MVYYSKLRKQEIGDTIDEIGEIDAVYLDFNFMVSKSKISSFQPDKFQMFMA